MRARALALLSTNGQRTSKGLGRPVGGYWLRQGLGLGHLARQVLGCVPQS